MAAPLAGPTVFSMNPIKKVSFSKLIFKELLFEVERKNATITTLSVIAQGLLWGTESWLRRVWHTDRACLTAYYFVIGWLKPATLEPNTMFEICVSQLIVTRRKDIHNAISNDNTL